MLAALKEAGTFPEIDSLTCEHVVLVQLSLFSHVVNETFPVSED